MSKLQKELKGLAKKRAALITKIKDVVNRALENDGMEFVDAMEALGDSIAELASWQRAIRIELKNWTITKDSE
jgi:hypothetical protein